MSTLTKIPVTVLHHSLDLLRLPLTAAERVAGYQDDESWPPSVAFESFEAQVKTVTGTLLRDPELREEAQLQRARVAELRRAGDLDARATAERVQAEQELEAKREEAAAEADEAREKRAQKKAAADRRATEAKKATRRQTAAKKKAAAKRKELVVDELEDTQTVVEAAALEEKREALAAKKQAVTAKSRARDLDKAADATRARRRSAKGA